jgi:Icc-related predicted phosphoesterase
MTRRPQLNGQRWTLRLFFALSAGALALGMSSCTPYRAPPFALGPLENPWSRHFAVIGDLQSTLPVEAWRENNDRERQRLLPEVARTRPAFVVMVGDLVSWGSSTSRWREFDERSEDLRRYDIPVLAVPGNHDYWGGGELRHYFAHLPEIRGQHWYERRYGPLGMIFLDSNAGPLGPAEWEKQRRWYEAALDRLEADAGVRGVLVFLHHAPITNSSVVDDDASVLRALVPPFLKREKTLAMVTGHAHGYERFEKQGKAFVVTAGGGGPRSPLLSDEKRRHPDDLFRGPRLRPFNFVEFSLGPRSLHAYVIGLRKGERTFCRMEEFDLAWSQGAAPLAASTPAAPERDLRDCCPADDVNPNLAGGEKPSP